MSNNNYNKNNQNQREVQNYEEQIKRSIHDLSAMREMRKRKCNHKPSKKYSIVELNKSGINVPNKKELKDSTVVCTRCEKYFENDPYTPSEIEGGLYMFNSMVEQVKVFSELKEEDFAAIDDYYAALDTIASFINYYNDMTNKLGNNNKNKNNNNRAVNKGSIGLNNSMFNSRGF